MWLVAGIANTTLPALATAASNQPLQHLGDTLTAHIQPRPPRAAWQCTCLPLVVAALCFVLTECLLRAGCESAGGRHTAGAGHASRTGHKPHSACWSALTQWWPASTSSYRICLAIWYDTLEHITQLQAAPYALLLLLLTKVATSAGVVEPLTPRLCTTCLLILVAHTLTLLAITMCLPKPQLPTNEAPIVRNCAQNAYMLCSIRIAGKRRAIRTKPSLTVRQGHKRFAAHKSSMRVFAGILVVAAARMHVQHWPAMSTHGAQSGNNHNLTCMPATLARSSHHQTLLAGAMTHMREHYVVWLSGTARHHTFNTAGQVLAAPLPVTTAAKSTTTSNKPPAGHNNVTPNAPNNPLTPLPLMPGLTSTPTAILSSPSAHERLPTQHEICLGGGGSTSQSVHNTSAATWTPHTGTPDVTPVRAMAGKTEVCIPKHRRLGL